MVHDGVDGSPLGVSLLLHPQQSPGVPTALMSLLWALIMLYGIIGKVKVASGEEMATGNMDYWSLICRMNFFKMSFSLDWMDQVPSITSAHSRSDKLNILKAVCCEM
jgi:hypothetical protein